MTFPNHSFLLNMTVASRTKDYKPNYAASVRKIEKNQGVRGGKGIHRKDCGL